MNKINKDSLELVGNERPSATNKHFRAHCCLPFRKNQNFLNHQPKIAIMKKIILTLLFLAPFIGFAQALKEYHASNGKTYHPGDTIRVGLGSMPDGNFKYIQVNELLPGPPHRNGNMLNAHKDMSGSNYVIKKIKNETQAGGTNKIVFTIKTGGLPTYNIWIEEAIASCEVTPCNDQKTGTSPNFSVADELLKLKKLVDAGAITPAEYNAQKKKLLGE